MMKNMFVAISRLLDIRRDKLMDLLSEVCLLSLVCRNRAITTTTTTKIINPIKNSSCCQTEVTRNA